MKKEMLVKMAILFVIIACTGCASIVDGRKKVVRVNSNPPGATVSIVDKSGKSVAVTNTPATIRLKRQSGFFAGQDYKLLFESPGYYPSEIHVKSTMNVWYLGNIVFGGLIGFVIVDPLTGAMWTLNPTDVNRNLIATTANLNPEQLKIAELEANPPPKPKKPAANASDRKY